MSIYEYLPTMYHCKVMVVDDLWVSVGSTNFDNRSFRLNDEANLNALCRNSQPSRQRFSRTIKVGRVSHARPMETPAAKRENRRNAGRTAAIASVRSAVSRETIPRRGYSVRSGCRDTHAVPRLSALKYRP